jgi:DNA helicase IV
VLATLQPNQYRLVTWPANEALVVQGHPGTGKTIVATHRAAYLAHPEREDGVGPLRVALLGPTSSYVEHVGAAMKALDAGDVDVFSVSGLLRRLGGQDAEPGRLGSSEADSAQELWQLAATATDHVRRAGELGSGSYGEQVRRVAQAVIDRSHGLMSMPVPTEIDAWMSRLTIAAVLTEARFAPFLAAIGLAVRPWPDSERYDHIIIDEAQDLLPLEWQVVLALCRQEASVTILGDLNQRRSEFGVRSWSSLAAGLGIARSAAHFAPEVIDVGFRSTARILQFANQLLPREQRFVRSLRSGNPPTVRRVRREDVLRVAIDEATDVASRHASGLTAVIAMTNQAVADELRRRRWRRAGPLRWRLSGQTLVVLHPEEARGLEFDGVVVIEPRLFPESNGRQGLLYTSLTRATKELVVVHSQPLPSGLRPPRKRSST